MYCKATCPKLAFTLTTSEVKKRNFHTPEFKAKVGREALTGDKTINEIAQRRTGHRVNRQAGAAAHAPAGSGGQGTGQEDEPGPPGAQDLHLPAAHGSAGAAATEQIDDGQKNGRAHKRDQQRWQTEVATSRAITCGLKKRKFPAKMLYFI